jgi:hypothetical protein
MADAPRLDRETRRVIETGSPLSPLDQDIIGSLAMQLRWQLTDQLDLRRVAAILRHFANRLEIISDPRRFETRTALLMAKLERKMTQDKLASKPRVR